MATSEGDRQRALAEAHDVEAARARLRGALHDRGDDGERLVREVLEPLASEGWTLLHHRRWPGTRRADLDHVLVGPGGVVVLDTKNWRTAVRLSHGRLMQGQDDVTSEVDGLLAQIGAIEDVVATQGLAPLQVTGALVFVGQDVSPASLGKALILDERHVLRWLRTLGKRLDPPAVAALSALVADAAPPYAPSPTAVPVVLPRPRPRTPEPSLSLFDVEELDLAELDRASQMSLDQWMVYLHPTQLEVVRRRYGGPCRVRGPAGCGKTVVALHRAAYLASQAPGDLLLASYVRTLPQVLSTLYRRLSPQTVDRVRFTGVHQLAMHVLREAGIDPRLDVGAAESAFNRAWAQSGRAHLESAALPRSYWYEEVLYVIKGRGLNDYDDYRTLTRTGRRTGLSSQQREHVWDLRTKYQEILEERQVRDFSDIMALALRVAEAGSAKSYRFVVVDEAQDLDLTSVRLLHSLVADPADGLTLVGDGQQALYPGGYTLKEAGVAVTGRSTVLTVNYRNTRQVLEAAHEVVRHDDFDDLEDVGQAGDRVMDVVREGSAVLDVAAADSYSADVALLARLEEDVLLGLDRGEAAVLVRTGREAAAIHRLLRAAGIPTLDLVRWDGSVVDAVKVGTTKRAKGLEFARVYLPRIDAYLVADGDAEDERVQRERRELFVAMTRARDGLWRCRVVEAVT